MTQEYWMTLADRNNTGILQKINVYSQHDYRMIGHGWILHMGERISNPTLIDLNGNPMEMGWYFIEVTDESHLVVAPRGIH